MTSAIDEQVLDADINRQIDQIDTKYRDHDRAWVLLLHSADQASRWISSEYVTHRLKSTSAEILVTSSRCALAYGSDEIDLVLVAHMPELGGKVVLKWYGESLWQWNGLEFDRTYTIVQTVLPKPFVPLERSDRKRSIATHADSDDALKRPRKMTRPLTPSTASEDEGSIHHGLSQSRQQIAQGVEKPSNITKELELLQTHIPSSSRDVRSLSIRQSIPARTPEPEDPVRNISQNIDTQGASDTMNDSEDVMQANVPPADRPNTTTPSQHFKEIHTTFIFIDRSTGTRHARDFSVCNSLRELFWFAQLTNAIAPGSSRCALAMTIGTTKKRVGQGKDEAGFQEMLEAIWNSRCWQAGEEAKCEVRVRELVLA